MKSFLSRFKKPAAQILVPVSALALSSAPAVGQTVNLNCPQQVVFGYHYPCGNGSLQIRPDGVTNIVGCLITTLPAQAGSCRVNVTGGVPTRSVVVSFAASSAMIKMGVDNFVFDDLRMKRRGGTATVTQLTLSPTQLTGVVIVDIGGTVNFSGNQAAGAYDGNLTVNADFN